MASPDKPRVNNIPEATRKKIAKDMKKANLDEIFKKAPKTQTFPSIPEIPPVTLTKQDSGIKRTLTKLQPHES